MDFLEAGASIMGKPYPFAGEEIHNTDEIVGFFASIRVRV